MALMEARVASLSSAPVRVRVSLKLRVGFSQGWVGVGVRTRFRVVFRVRS